MADEELRARTERNMERFNIPKGMDPPVETKPWLKMRRSMKEHGWDDDDRMVVWLNETIAKIEEFENDCQRFADAFNYALQGRDFDDVFPWHFTPYVAPDDTDCGGISTPNGRRPDGTQHTYWTVTGETWEPWGRLIVEVVNSAARAIRPAAGPGGET